MTEEIQARAVGAYLELVVPVTRDITFALTYGERKLIRHLLEHEEITNHEIVMMLTKQKSIPYDTARQSVEYLALNLDELWPHDH